MTTIRRNWTKRITAVRAAATHCRGYDSSTGNMLDLAPEAAWRAYEANPHARLIENTPGRKWTVHVHSNAFYYLTAGPEQNEQARTATSAPAPAPAAARTAPAGRTAKEDAVLREVGEFIADAPGIGARTAAAATSAIGRKVAQGAIRRDNLTDALPGATAAIAAKTVQTLRDQGMTHEQIRQRFTRLRAEAQHGGQLGRVTAADALIAAHAGIVADEEARTPAATAAPTPREIDAPTPAPETTAGQPVEATPREAAEKARRDDLAAALDAATAATAALTEELVSRLRAEGSSHLEIRARVERARAAARACGDEARATVANALLAAHAPLAAKESRRTATPPELPRVPAEPAPFDPEKDRRTCEVNRRCEERNRPTVAHVYVSPITGSATLRWLDVRGRDTESLWEPSALPGTQYPHAMAPALHSEAGAFLARKGFRPAPGARWQPSALGNGDATARPGGARIAIEPTAAYLDWQERRFGPVPELPDAPGVTIRATQRGQWVCQRGPRSYLLTWSPALGGDRWRLWGGDTHSTLVRTSATAGGALAALAEAS
ncbi:hypothetical protein [Streptomyces sp. CA-253872]|uniref:hypothetical protein n=1 Tax=Streptomyces sp. CA-253872 TaxID=3240067 RepID=UPI003D92B586